MSWRGELGRQYLESNRDAGRDRWDFWRMLQQRCPFSSALEVGCGGANNLQWIVNWKTGVDLSMEALALARQRCPTARLSVARASALPFRDRSFDCVISCGLLIHIAPPDLGRAMDEMARVSDRYALIMEYHAERETVIRWRGHADMLWKRPYAKWFGERSKWKNVARGFLGHDRGFDDLHWDMWQRP